MFFIVIFFALLTTSTVCFFTVSLPVCECICAVVCLFVSLFVCVNKLNEVSSNVYYYYYYHYYINGISSQVLFPIMKIKKRENEGKSI